jgi:hypothetical protein
MNSLVEVWHVRVVLLRMSGKDAGVECVNLPSFVVSLGRGKVGEALGMRVDIQWCWDLNAGEVGQDFWLGDSLSRQNIRRIDAIAMTTIGVVDDWSSG